MSGSLKSLFTENMSQLAFPFSYLTPFCSPSLPEDSSLKNKVNK